MCGCKGRNLSLNAQFFVVFQSVLLVVLFTAAGCGYEQSFPTDSAANPANDPEVARNSSLTHQPNSNVGGIVEDKNRALWRAKGPSDYSFVVQQFAGGLYSFVPMSVTVRDGKPVEVKWTEPPNQLDRVDGYESLKTIEAIFEKIAFEKQNDQNVRVVYDKKLGYPIEVVMSGKVNSPADDHYRILVTNFRSIENSK